MGNLIKSFILWLLEIFFRATPSAFLPAHVSADVKLLSAMGDLKAQVDKNERIKKFKEKGYDDQRFQGYQGEAEFLANKLIGCMQAFQDPVRVEPLTIDDKTLVPLWNETVKLTAFLDAEIKNRGN